MAPTVGERYDPSNPDHAATPPAGLSPTGAAPEAGDAGGAIPPASPASPAPPKGAGDDAGTSSSAPSSATSKKARPRATRRPEPAPKAPPRGPGKPSNHQRRAERVGGMLLTTGAVLLPFQPHDGVAVIDQAPRIAEALATLADHNPTIARFLDSAAGSSAWIGVGIAVAPLIVTLLANHGVLPTEVASLINTAVGATEGAPSANAQPSLLDFLAAPADPSASAAAA